MRSAGAVAAGFLIYTLAALLSIQVSGQAPGTALTWPRLALSTVYGALAGIVAGFITGRLSPRAEVRHSVIVAALILLASSASWLAFQGPAPSTWSLVGTFVADAPATVLGGALSRARDRSRRTTARA